MEYNFRVTDVTGHEFFATIFAESKEKAATKLSWLYSPIEAHIVDCTDEYGGRKKNGNDKIRC